jgi:hypothetical protein
MNRRPDLIVPIRDRRQRKRYLTLKNFGIVVLVLVVAFVAISTRSEMRSLKPGDYGRLFRREVPSPIEPKPMEVVREEPPPVGDQTHAAPMLVEPMDRAHWLSVDTTRDPPTTAVAPVVSAASLRGEADVVIVGGAEGVAVVKREKRRPVLSGGFGR